MNAKRMYFSPVTTPFCLVLVLTFFFISQTDGLATMYICKDNRGGVSFTNVPAFANCRPFSMKKKGSAGWRSGVRKSYDSGKYDKNIVRVARRYNVDPHLIKAIIQTESDFDHRAVSKQGAQGLMQLMPATARELRVFNPFNPQENIDGGTRYFRTLLDIFDGNVKLSLAAYNAGPGLVQRTNGIPEIPETVRYVKKVLRQYKVYKTLGDTLVLR